jgi:hypothetical protein
VQHIRQRGEEKELIKKILLFSEEMGCYRKNKFVAQDSENY